MSSVAPGSRGELHSNLTQSARERNLTAFAAGVTRVMVATDIAARGIHVDGVDLVVPAGSPAEHKAYLHRAGWTARAGAAGTVVTLQTTAQPGEVRVMMRKARVILLAAPVTPRAALLRSISGHPVSPVKPQARPARTATAVIVPWHRRRRRGIFRQLPRPPLSFGALRGPAGNERQNGR